MTKTLDERRRDLQVAIASLDYARNRLAVAQEDYERTDDYTGRLACEISALDAMRIKAEANVEARRKALHAEMRKATV